MSDKIIPLPGREGMSRDAFLAEADRLQLAFVDAVKASFGRQAVAICAISRSAPAEQDRPEYISSACTLTHPDTNSEQLVQAIATIVDVVARNEEWNEWQALQFCQKISDVIQREITNGGWNS